MDCRSGSLIKDHKRRTMVHAKTKSTLPPRQTALVDSAHSQNGGHGHFVQSYVRTERRQWPFLKSSNNSQLILASRKRLTSATAVRHRSNSSSCCVLKSPSGRKGLRTILDDTQKLPFDGLTGDKCCPGERGSTCPMLQN